MKITVVTAILLLGCMVQGARKYHTVQHTLKIMNKPNVWNLLYFIIQILKLIPWWTNSVSVIKARHARKSHGYGSMSIAVWDPSGLKETSLVLRWYKHRETVNISLSHAYGHDEELVRTDLFPNFHQFQKYCARYGGKVVSVHTDFEREQVSCLVYRTKDADTVIWIGARKDNPHVSWVFTGLFPGQTSTGAPYA